MSTTPVSGAVYDTEKRVGRFLRSDTLGTTFGKVDVFGVKPNALIYCVSTLFDPSPLSFLRPEHSPFGLCPSVASFIVLV